MRSRKMNIDLKEAFDLILRHVDSLTGEIVVVDLQPNLVVGGY